MQRRDVLKAGAAAAAMSGAGCAALLQNPGQVGDDTLPGFLSALDAAMAKVGAGDFLTRFLGQNDAPEVKAKVTSAEGLAKKTLRSLLMVGTLSELEPKQLAHPSVQGRLLGAMGEFDDAMFGMAETLERLTPAERADITRRLNSDPGLGMRLMGAVDEQAAEFGVSAKQRTRLRAISAHCTSRLRLSTDLAATEYVEKMKKIAARQGPAAQAAREGAAQMASQLLFQRAATGGSSAADEPSAPPPPAPSLPPPPPPPDQRRDEPARVPVTPADQPPAEGQGAVVEPDDWAQEQRPAFRTPHALITAGGAALGLAVLVFGVGFAVGGAGPLLGITFGAILGVSGLVVLLIGLIMLGAGK